MIDWATRTARLATVITTAFGESVTHIDATNTSRTVLAVVDRRSDPVFLGGSISFSEGRYAAMVQTSDGMVIARGDTIIGSDGVEYEVDGAPHMESGLWAVDMHKMS